MKLEQLKKERIRIILKSYDQRLLDDAVKTIIEIVKRTGAMFSGPVFLPTKIRRYTVLRSPHVDKKSREQFELRIHKRVIDVIEPTAKTIEDLTRAEISAGIEVVLKT